MSCYDARTRAALTEESASRAKQDAAFQARVLALVADGLTDRAVAERMGCSRSRVGNIRERAGLAKKKADAWEGLL